MSMLPIAECSPDQEGLQYEGQIAVTAAGKDCQRYCLLKDSIMSLNTIIIVLYIVNTTHTYYCVSLKNSL